MSQSKIFENRAFQATMVAATFVAGATFGYKWMQSNEKQTIVDRPDLNANLNMQTSPSETTYESFQWAMQGYNLIQGNPLSFGSALPDPGFSQQYVFAVQQATQEYGGWIAPSGWVIYSLDSCQAQPATNFFYGMTEYGEYLEKMVAYKPSPFGAAFGNNLTTTKLENAFYNNFQMISLTEQICEVYTMEISPFDPPAPSETFVEAIKEMTEAETYNPELYYQFFRNYGTHFQTKSIAGAALYDYELWDDIDAILHTNGINESLQKESYSSQFSSYSRPNKNQQDSTNAFSSIFSASMETGQVNIGPSPTGLSVDQWAEAAEQNPMPIYIELLPLYELLESPWLTMNFPQTGLTTINLGTVADNMQTAAKDYCQYLWEQNHQATAYCEIYTPDPAMGFGTPLTDDFGGEWGRLIRPDHLFNSTWIVQYSDTDGITGLCVTTETGDEHCTLEDSYPSGQNTLNVPGPINSVNVLIDQNSHYADLSFGYIDMEGKQAYSPWACGNTEVEPKISGQNYNNQSLKASGYDIKSIDIVGGTLAALSIMSTNGYLQNLITYNMIVDNDEI